MTTKQNKCLKNSVTLLTIEDIKKDNLQTIKDLVKNCDGFQYYSLCYGIIYFSIINGSSNIKDWIIKDSNLLAMEYEDKNNIAQMAAIEGDIEILKLLGSAHPLLNSVNEHGENIAHLAALTGNINILKWLGKYHPLVNAVNKEGENIAHIAASTGNVDILQWLGQERILTNAVNHDGDNIVHIAASTGNTSILQWLGPNDPLIYKVNNYGYNIAQAATINGNINILNLLGKNHALVDPSSKYNNADTDNIAQIAASEGKIEVLAWLGKDHPLIFIINKKGESLYDIAAKAKQDNITQWLKINSTSFPKNSLNISDDVQDNIPDDKSVVNEKLSNIKDRETTYNYEDEKLVKSPLSSTAHLMTLNTTLDNLINTTEYIKNPLIEEEVSIKIIGGSIS